MSFEAERIYQLLPAFIRVQDAGQGEPLKALLEVISRQAGVLDEDISRLYKNWFIETCDEWVVSYIGDLVGVRGLHPVSESTYSLRALVANTIMYRRRKGTAAVLEQLARDVTGWNARAVEFFRLLGTTQNINHLRPANFRTPDLHDPDVLELLDSPFDSTAHTADVRRIKSERGKYNIPNIGIFLWRLQAYPADWSPAFSHGAGKFSFSPLGNDMPLFNHPQTEKEITHLADEVNVPAPIRRLGLKNDKLSYYGKAYSVCIRKGGQLVPAEDIISCNLSGWLHRPPSGKVALDPVLGRVSFPVGESPNPNSVKVKYYYGFSSEVGGGWYPRDFELVQNDVKFFKIGGENPDFSKIADAYTSWKTNFPGQNAVLQINDSRVYKESLSLIIPAGRTLEIRAAEGEFPLLKLSANFRIRGQKGTSVILNGLRISSHPVVIGNGDLGFLVLRHCTLVPGLEIDADCNPKSPDEISLRASNGNMDLKVTIERCICGGIKLLDSHDLEIMESIVQGLNKKAVNGPNLKVEGSTLLGDVSVRKISLASDTVFTKIIKAELTQEGCVRFCYVPEDSQAPRRYRCQPDLAIKKAVDAASEVQSPLPAAKREEIEKNIRLWLKPVFSAKRYGKPGYGQLGLNCPREIFEGADDGSEMGVFHHLKQPLRLANLRAGLEEYLPASMEAGIFFMD